MKILYLIVTFSILFTSCSNVNKINFKEVEYIFIDYTPQKGNNYYSTIDARVCVKTIYGEIIRIKKQSALSTSDNVRLNLNGESLVVTSPPHRFNDSLVKVGFKLTNKLGEYIESEDTIVLNYRKELKIKSLGEKGRNGATGANGNTALIFRHGKEGEPGNNGLNGSNGDDYEINIWKENGFYMIQTNNIRQSTINTYQIKGAFPFQLLSKGGIGGNGGDGGNGGNGKPGIKTETKIKTPGKGGDAGPGGSGGRGGNGGNIICNIHPNAQEFQSLLILQSQPGNGGKAGKSGQPGLAGNALSGQKQPTNGRNSFKGTSGQRGLTGMVQIQVVEFEIPQQYRQ